MPTLFYRGQNYTKVKASSQINQSVELSYRRSLYKRKKLGIFTERTELRYRGNKYYSKKAKSPWNKLMQKEDQRKVFSLTLNIIEAQFQQADEVLTQQLWDQVAESGIDPMRIINLLYKCMMNNDNESMKKFDFEYLQGR